MSAGPLTGTIGWFDLTVDDAESVRDFYKDVVGWTSSPLSMGDYDDFVMATPDGTPVAGVCHARGSNQGLPAKWLLYVNVDDIDASREACQRHGGKLVTDVKQVKGQGAFCVIEDPAGAVMALFEPESSQD